MNMSDHRQWLAYTLSDLAAAKGLLANPDHYPRQVCYLSQQAAEKALKAALLWSVVRRRSSVVR